MVSFWQLSGPDSHFARIWKVPKGEPIGNAKIALQISRSMSLKLDGGGQAIDLILGIDTSGASHILVPQNAEPYLRELNWRHKNPYPASRFASLSPILVGKERLQILLENRQVVSKSKTTSKLKGDNSKANRVFWDGPPRPERAAFEHGRCFWRILHQELNPQIYGLPAAPWGGGLDIISLAMNFWSADGTTLLDAGITCIHLPPHRGSDPNEERGYTWYFKTKDREVLRNSTHPMTVEIPVTWKTIEVENCNKADIGTKIQTILGAHSHVNSAPPAPLVLLVHDYAAVRGSLESLGIQTSLWKYELKELLGYNTLHSTQLRGTIGSSIKPLSHASSFVTVPSYAPVYVVDTLMMFKTVTGSGNHSSTIRPVDVFNKITLSCENDGSCGGSDSNYILQSWKSMVTGISLDEQKEFYANSLMPLPARPGTDSGVPEDIRRYQVEEPRDLFYDGSDSEDD